MKKAPYFRHTFAPGATSAAATITLLGMDGGVTFTQTYSTTVTTVPTITSGAGTGADGTTPSGAEHSLAVDDITANRGLINSIIDALQTAGIVT